MSPPYLAPNCPFFYEMVILSISDILFITWLADRDEGIDSNILLIIKKKTKTEFLEFYVLQIPKQTIHSPSCVLSSRKPLKSESRTLHMTQAQALESYGRCYHNSG